LVEQPLAAPMDNIKHIQKLLFTQYTSKRNFQIDSELGEIFTNFQSSKAVAYKKVKIKKISEHSSTSAHSLLLLLLNVDEPIK
jgi:hypothetical protein